MLALKCYYIAAAANGDGVGTAIAGSIKLLRKSSACVILCVCIYFVYVYQFSSVHSSFAWKL